MNIILDELPQHLIEEIGCLRLNQVLKLVPFGRTKWLEGVKSGVFPQPGNFGPRTPAWRIRDIKKVVNHAFENVPE